MAWHKSSGKAAKKRILLRAFFALNGRIATKAMTTDEAKLRASEEGVKKLRYAARSDVSSSLSAGWQWAKARLAWRAAGGGGVSRDVCGLWCGAENGGGKA
jgi:hypothetical protein